MSPHAPSPAVVGVKICGIRTREVADACVHAGAQALGFVLAPSVRRVTPADVRAIIGQLANDLPAHVWRVAVFKRLDDAQSQADLRALARDAGVTHVQADWLDEPLAHELAPDLTFLPVFRDVPTLRIDLGHEATRAQPRMVLLEGALSGIGMLPDWGRLARAAHAVPGGRFMLAGGLAPHNVADAIRAVRPAMVDVSSGVERAPGEKDPRLIVEFIRAAHQQRP